ncbi:glycoside hydrolase family protein [Venturia nashicola]|nr:glycoside hydrolase family protein [Venturia nashicola]
MYSAKALFLAFIPLLPFVSADIFYAQSDIYQGHTFFDRFDFFTDADPTEGYVDYKSRADAKNLGLISSTDTTATWGVGGGVLDPNDNTVRGRASVRLEGKTSYTKGLFIADIAHMPGNACGIWPAFWTLGSGPWPLNGEIDIIESVNQVTRNKASLHTGKTTCAINNIPMQGSIASRDCQTTHNGVMDNYVGCGIDSGSNAGFGDPFNAGNGGTYALQWTDTFIKTWFFPRGSEPDSFSCSAPDVSKFGTPDSFFSGCDIASNFKDNRLVFDTTFCGSWAGADGVYNTSGCPLTFSSSEPQWKSCKAQVAAHPETFDDG